MAWRILRTTDDNDDPDWVAAGSSPGAILIQTADLRRSPEGKFAVRATWLNDDDTIGAGYGVVTFQVTTVEDMPGAPGLVSIGPPASLSSPPVTTARTPMLLDAPLTESSALTLRCSSMTAPGDARRLRIYVETVDP